MFAIWFQIAALDFEEYNLLRPDVEEDAVAILVVEADWATEDVLVFARLVWPIDLGIEKRGDAKFVFVCFGPALEQNHVRHIEASEAVAALLQEETVCNAAYEAKQPEEFTKAINEALHQVRTLPHIHHPTAKTVMNRTEKLFKQRLGLGDHFSQLSKWNQNQDLKKLFRQQLSLGKVVKVMRKLALPLLAGIATALVMSNSYIYSYEKWCTLLAHHIFDAVQICS